MFTLLLFCGVQLLILGIAGEYIGRLYLTTNKRPQFVVRNVVTQKSQRVEEELHSLFPNTNDRATINREQI